MRRWAILAAAGLLLLLFALLNTEHFTDTEFTTVTQPCFCPPSSDMSVQSRSFSCDPSCATWYSKVEALAPRGAETQDYITVLRAFYDQVYTPSATKPTEAQVDTFLASSAGTVAGVDIPSVKRILMTGFHIDSSHTAAQNEDASQKFKPSDANLAPKMGRDEVRTREEGGYTGANPSSSTTFSEGNYAPPPQTQPNKPGEWDDGTMMWKGPRPASVCPCAENIM